MVRKNASVAGGTGWTAKELAARPAQLLSPSASLGASDDEPEASDGEEAGEEVEQLAEAVDALQRRYRENPVSKTLPRLGSSQLDEMPP